MGDEVPIIKGHQQMLFSSQVIQKFCSLDISPQERLYLPMPLELLWTCLRTFTKHIRHTKYCPLYYVVCIQDITYCSTLCRNKKKIEWQRVLTDKFKDFSTYYPWFFTSCRQAGKWVASFHVKVTSLLTIINHIDQLLHRVNTACLS
jgi:hypothetical protein